MLDSKWKQHDFTTKFNSLEEVIVRVLEQFDSDADWKFASEQVGGWASSTDNNQETQWSFLWEKVLHEMRYWAANENQALYLLLTVYSDVWPSLPLDWQLHWREESMDIYGVSISVKRLVNIWGGAGNPDFDGGLELFLCDVNRNNSLFDIYSAYFCINILSMFLYLS